MIDLLHNVLLGAFHGALFAAGFLAGMGFCQ